MQRLQFDVTSPNGVLLFREASKTIACYGEHILTLTDIPDDKLYAVKYPHHSKNSYLSPPPNGSLGSETILLLGGCRLPSRSPLSHTLPQRSEQRVLCDVYTQIEWRVWLPSSRSPLVPLPTEWKITSRLSPPRMLPEVISFPSLQHGSLAKESSR